VPVNAEITFLLFKERRPFRLKKECPSEQWQVISFQLIPLKTPVSFRWTVPLRGPCRIFSQNGGILSQKHVFKFVQKDMFHVIFEKNIVGLTLKTFEKATRILGLSKKEYKLCVYC
jgi:hypothetical protein